MPSGALVAIMACGICRTKIREPVEKGNLLSDLYEKIEKNYIEWKRCNGGCGQVLPVNKMNTLSSRGKPPKYVCSKCTIGVMNIKEQLN